MRHCLNSCDFELRWSQYCTRKIENAQKLSPCLLREYISLCRPATIWDSFFLTYAVSSTPLFRGYLKLDQVGRRQFSLKPLDIHETMPLQGGFLSNHYHTRKALTRGRIDRFSDISSSCDHELWSITLPFELDLDSIKSNRHVICIGQRSFISKVIVRTYTHIHTGPISLPGLLKWLVNMQWYYMRHWQINIHA